MAYEHLSVLALVTTRRLTVDVLDMNENAAQFTRSSCTARLKENNESDTVLTQVNATDADVDSIIEYRLSNETSMFTVNPR